MKRTLLTVLLLGAAIGATGCGGSTTPPRQTIRVVEPGTTPTTSTTDPKTGSVHPKQATAPAPAQAHQATTTAPKVPPEPPKSQVIATTPTQDAASTCLTSAGLAHVGVVRQNEWAGTDRLHVKPVFVDGPYKSAKAAAKAAASLNGIEVAESGGLYSVSAVLSSHVGADVKAVASCLARAPKVTSNGKALTF